MPKKDGSFDVRLMPNPNRPQIDPDSRAVANAVVYLRKIDTAAAKPWTHGDVRVELTDRQIVVRQGDDPPRRVGFVRRGKPVDLVATDPFFHALRGRGAAFFTFHASNSPGVKCLLWHRAHWFITRSSSWDIRYAAGWSNPLIGQGLSVAMCDAHVLTDALLANDEWNSDRPDPGTSKAPYKLYNIGNNNPVELLHFIEVLEQCLGKTAQKRLLQFHPLLPSGHQLLSGRRSSRCLLLGLARAGRQRAMQDGDDQEREAFAAGSASSLGQFRSVGGWRRKYHLRQGRQAGGRSGKNQPGNRDCS